MPAVSPSPIIAAGPRVAAVTTSRSGSHPVGTGPFRFQSWQRGGELVLARNDGYWGDKAFVDRIVVTAIPDLNGRVSALEAGDADVIVEITGDCPIIDPEVVEQTIRMFACHDATYVSNVVVPTYPDGMETQVFTFEALKKSEAMTRDPLDREHVSRHIIHNPELFPQVHLVAPPSMHWPGLGLTLDLKKPLCLSGQRWPPATCACRERDAEADRAPLACAASPS